MLPPAHYPYSTRPLSLSISLYAGILYVKNNAANAQHVRASMSSEKFTHVALHFYDSLFEKHNCIFYLCSSRLQSQCMGGGIKYAIVWKLFKQILFGNVMDLLVEERKKCFSYDLCVF